MSKEQHVKNIVFILGLMSGLAFIGVVIYGAVTNPN